MKDLHKKQMSDEAVHAANEQNKFVQLSKSLRSIAEEVASNLNADESRKAGIVTRYTSLAIKHKPEEAKSVAKSFLDTDLNGIVTQSEIDRMKSKLH